MIGSNEKTGEELRRQDEKEEFKIIAGFSVASDKIEKIDGQIASLQKDRQFALEDLMFQIQKLSENQIRNFKNNAESPVVREAARIVLAIAKGEH